MRARLKRLHSPDVADLESWSPGDKDFGLLLQAMIGPDGNDGEESFSLTVCTPDWFSGHRMEQGLRMGSQTLFVARYDYLLIRHFIERAAQRAEADNWQELALGLSWLGEWEFANYRARVDQHDLRS
jgi:hypothetical protein